MTRSKTTQFAEAEDTEEGSPEIELNDDVVVTSDLRSARIKGTWTMYWGTERFFFEDGKRYKIPTDLYGYLRDRGNIYDTL